MKRSRSAWQDLFKFRILSPEHYLDALLFWSIYISSSIFILWLLASTAKNQLRETLATQFVRLSQQTVAVLNSFEDLGTQQATNYLQTIPKIYPEVEGLGVVELQGTGKLKLVTRPIFSKIGFDDETHLPFIRQTLQDKRFSISDWEIFTSKSATFLTPSARKLEFIYAKLTPFSATETSSSRVLIVAYDGPETQQGFYAIEELGITAMCISILLGTLFAIFVRFRSAQRIAAIQDKFEALESLRIRDRGLNLIVEAADRMLGRESVDEVLASLMNDLSEAWNLEVFFALLVPLARTPNVSAPFIVKGKVPVGWKLESLEEFSQALPDYWQKLNNREAVVFRRKEAPALLRPWMARNQLSCIAVIGLLQKKNITGLLIVGKKTGELLMDSGVIETLRVLADIFSAGYEQREQDRYIRESSKMEALGRVAGGVAHEFNNLLHIILGNLRYGTADRALDAQNIRFRRIVEAAGRGTRIVDQLLGASRMNAPDLRQGDLNTVVEETVELARSATDPDIQIDFFPGDSMPPGLMDESQIQQVILNLLLNARDAVSGKGTITVHTGLAGGEIYCEVIDNGHGFEQENAQRLFEPFFTTKNPGQGTGLGLSTSRGILEQHRGRIEAESREAGGACFRFFLPAASGSSVEVRSSERVSRSLKGLRLNAPPGLVLAADDELLCREVLKDCLAEHSIPVTLFENGADLLEFIDRSTEPISWVITDWTMPGIHGMELIEKLNARLPRVSIFITSGFLLDAEEIPYVQGMINKPFTAEELIQALARAQP